MSSSTAKYAIPYPVAADAVNQEPVTVKALADRMDLLLGETGSFSAVLVANTTLSTVIALARVYPGNSGAAVPGTVVITVTSPVAATTVLNQWVSTWTGTGATVTGFTIGLQASAAITRTVTWRFIPAL